jgi:hypothetical protein
MLSGRQHTECCVGSALVATALASASLDGSLQLDFVSAPVSIFVRKSEAAFAFRLFSERERKYLYCCTNKASKVSTFVISQRELALVDIKERRCDSRPLQSQLINRQEASYTSSVRTHTLVA